MELTRRNFIAAAGTMLAACAGMGMAQSAYAFTTGDTVEKWDYESDVVVVGCGSGGAPAAIDAFDAGCSVTVVEKQSWLGGSMRRCGGGIAAPCTCVQKALGVEDDVEDFYKYVVACGNGLVDEDMMRVLADRSTEAFDWIVQDLAGQTEADWHFTDDTSKGHEIAMRPGLDLGGTPVYFDVYGCNEVPRTYWFAENPDDIDEDGTRLYAPDALLGRPDTDKGRGGTGLWKPMQDAIDARDINVLMSHAITELVINADGEVIGVKATDLEKSADVYIKAAKGVVIATGDFQNNAEMMMNYTLTGWMDREAADPNAVAADPTAHVINDVITGGWANADQADGMGIIASQAIGANTRLMAGGPWRGGLITDTNAQVLDVYGNPIPRLFASSYAVGGKWGVNYPMCGYHNMVNIVFGRVAAENVSKLDAWE